MKVRLHMDVFQNLLTPLIKPVQPQFFHLVIGFSNRFKDGFIYVYIYRTFNCGRFFSPKNTISKGFTRLQTWGPGDARCSVPLSFTTNQGVTVGLPVLAFWRGDPVMWMWSRGDSS